MLEVEMKRTSISLLSEADLWKEQGEEETRANPLGEGKKFYAFWQAAIRHSLVVKFNRMWSQPDKPRQVQLKRASTEEEEEEEEEEEVELAPQGSDREEED
ncbi:hypothetical protein V5O48_011344 [Marasmius crinis-equi]|uniref:Uncharacterized protein n=1 Tax=Marasmius crinis-equi TaxID=585013 RepID=A0ABR3F5U6_9AGAR